MIKYTSNSSKGFVLEVDLDYPKELAPNKIEIKTEMLSDYQLNIADLYNIPIGNVKKLLPIFLFFILFYFIFDKEKCLLHYEYLKLYLKLRLKLKKIHRLLKFNQSQWLKPYIEFNTQKGQKKMETKWKNFVQINGQHYICYIRKNNGKLEK